MKLVSLLSSLLVLLLPATLMAAAKPIPNPPELDASSYFLIDFESGRVLAEKNPPGFGSVAKYVVNATGRVLRY